MGKKNKNKKKRQKIQHKNISNPVVNQEIDSSVENSASPVSVEKKPAPVQNDETIIDEKSKILIRKDVRLIIITLILLLALIVVAKILQDKTEIINNFGNWLLRIFNIQML